MITTEELQEITVNAVARTTPLIVLERQPGDVVFVRFTRREQSVALVSPEEAAARLAQIGAEYSETLASLRRDPRDLNAGAWGYVWIAADLDGIPFAMTARFRSHAAVTPGALAN